MRNCLVLVFCVFFSDVALSNTLNVPGDYPTIQQAIDASVHGDTVLVSPGTYVENLDFKGKAITVTSSDGSKVTCIDGGNPVNPKFASVAAFMNNEGPDSVLEGFTLINGNGTFQEVVIYHNGQVGGAVFCKLSSPTIRDNFFAGNWADYGGAFGCIEGGEPLLSNNILMNNSAVLGGGIACVFDVSPTITDNCIRENSSTDTGGGIYSWDAFPLIKNNIIINNSSPYGGGIGYNSGVSKVVNNFIVENSANYGGGIYFGFANAPFIVNNTFYGNLSNHGRSICSWWSSPTVVNSIFWSQPQAKGPELLIGTTMYPSVLTISHCNIQGGSTAVVVEPGCTLNWGDGMFDADPQFVDVTQWDLHLTYQSPCRGSGDNSVPQLPAYDFEDDPRIYQGTVDVGADEFHNHLYCTGNFTPGGEMEVKFAGLPGTSPVGLFVGTEIREIPLVHMWGEFWIAEPWFAMPLMPIPSNGVLEVPYTIPVTHAAPYNIPMQALIGDRLTNLYVLEIR